MKRVLGIDPGSRITGYGIVEETQGKLVFVAYGAWQLSSKEFSDRLKEIYYNIEQLISEHKPTEVAIESVFFAKNAMSSIKLGQARGAAMTAVANQNLKVFEYSPAQVKQAVVGYGRADKEQIQKMVFLLLGLHGKAKVDATDALAVAICHLNSVKFQQVSKLYDRGPTR
ncbi:MAG: crossover junction endodeoxyribonuclease RuvC [Deltaproteobacteria bacterium]|nr:crossover junction endodeoxyribonuclease RuvC [Deltaproteobacteria bacterium]